MKKKLALPLAAGVALISVSGLSAHAQEKQMAEIFMTAAPFCPKGSMMADGRLLAVQEYQAVFSLLGTNYGGDGRTTFGLPDLRGRSPIGTGNGRSLDQVNLGQQGGIEHLTQTQLQFPPHNHGIGVAAVEGLQINKDASKGSQILVPRSEGTTEFGTSGNGQPFYNRDPYLGITYCVQIAGTYPQRP